MQSMLPETVDHHGADDEHGEREGDDEVTGHGKKVGEHAQKVRHQNKHEQREDHREEAHALRAGAVAQHRGHEFIGHFRDRLQARGHQAAIGGGQEQEACGCGNGADHEQRRIGERQVQPADLDGDELADLELVNRIV